MLNYEANSDRNIDIDVNFDPNADVEAQREQGFNVSGWKVERGEAGELRRDRRVRVGGVSGEHARRLVRVLPPDRHPVRAGGRLQPGPQVDRGLLHRLQGTITWWVLYYLYPGPPVDWWLLFGGYVIYKTQNLTH